MKTEQVKAGIATEHKQTIKTSEILLAVLLLFYVLPYSESGTGLTRALVHFMAKKDDLSWM